MALVRSDLVTLKLVYVNPSLETLCLERGRLDGLEADFGGLGAGERAGFLGEMGGERVAASSVLGFDGAVSR